MTHWVVFVCIAYFDGFPDRKWLVVRRFSCHSFVCAWRICLDGSCHPLLQQMLAVDIILIGLAIWWSGLPEQTWSWMSKQSEGHSGCIPRQSSQSVDVRLQLDKYRKMALKCPLLMYSLAIWLEHGALAIVDLSIRSTDWPRFGIIVTLLLALYLVINDYLWIDVKSDV